MIRLVISVLLLVFASQAVSNQELVDELFAFLNLEEKHLPKLFEKGEIIYTGMPGAETLSEELAVSGALLLVNRPVLEVVETYLAEETFRGHHGILDYGYISNASPAADFAKVGFTAKETQELKRLGEVKAGTLFNIGSEEIKQLHSANDDLDQAYRELLRARAEAYLQNGVPGIKDYARSSGKSASPAIELQTALKSMAGILKQFPKFLAAAENYPAASDELEHRYMWIKTHEDSRPLYVLSHHMVEKRGKVALGIERHYYVGHGYNSLLTLVGVVPWEGNSLVFVINHTFTNQVTGFAASVKKNQGRKLVGKRLVESLNELREMLESH